MKKCHPANLRYLYLLTAFFLAFTTSHAQLDYQTAKEVTNFTIPTATSNEILFNDFGVGQLQNGTAEILISPEIAATIDGKKIEELVSLSFQLEGKSNGVYVSKKNKNSFVLTELNNGSSNAKFSYQFVVKK